MRGRPTIAVDGLDLSVPEGGVFGFLGPNGSGKTTTIRCLLGLVSPSAGSCRLLGADVRTSLSQVIAQVGAVVESPAFFPSYSARQNLRLLGRLNGIGPARSTPCSSRSVSPSAVTTRCERYSLGMRQRLGLAGVLLKDPAVLILDEPANGLDPAGIREIRRLLRQLGDEGRTVFVSSHQLSEIQQICDRLAILRGGRCIATGSRARPAHGRPRPDCWCASATAPRERAPTARPRLPSPRSAPRACASSPPTTGCCSSTPPHVAAHVTETLGARPPLGDGDASAGAEPGRRLPRADGECHLITLITIELRRALSRRLVLVLVGLALLATAIAGVVAFIQTGKPTPDAPMALVELWPTSGQDPILGVPASCSSSAGCSRAHRSRARSGVRAA